jgi:hypothetical protein
MSFKLHNAQGRYRGKCNYGTRLPKRENHSYTKYVKQIQNGDSEIFRHMACLMSERCERN